MIDSEINESIFNPTLSMNIWNVSINCGIILGSNDDTIGNPEFFPHVPDGDITPKKLNNTGYYDIKLIAYHNFA